MRRACRARLSWQSPRELALCAEDYTSGQGKTHAGQDDHRGALLTNHWGLPVGSQQPMCRALIKHLAGTQVTV